MRDEIEIIKEIIMLLDFPRFLFSFRRNRIYFFAFFRPAILIPIQFLVRRTTTTMLGARE